eukprot:960634-Rhodomonas_salina.9
MQTSNSFFFTGMPKRLMLVSSNVMSSLVSVLLSHLAVSDALKGPIWTLLVKMPLREKPMASLSLIPKNVCVTSPTNAPSLPLEPPPVFVYNLQGFWVTTFRDTGQGWRERERAMHVFGVYPTHNSNVPSKY